MDLFRLLLALIYYCSNLLLVQAKVFECTATDPCGCSRNNVDINSRLIGGETVASRSWGWAVSVRNGYHVHICGGSILSKNVILTAAHCFRKVSDDPLPYSVATGIDSLLSITGQVRIVSQIFIHPKWNSTSKENDIAILKLATPIFMDDINVAKICLPDVIQSEQVRYPMLHSALVAIGWGVTTWEDLISPMYLRQVSLEAIDSTEPKCNNMIKNVNLQFCAAVIGGGKDTCQGDSGGPIMYFSPKKRRWILTGIISYGYRCALRDYTGVYTRISVYMQWIKLMVGDEDFITVEESSSMMTKTTSIFIIITSSLTSTIYFSCLSHVL